MSRFYVGQRVRVVQAFIAKNLGREAVISHIGHWGDGDALPSGWTYSCKNQYGYANAYLLMGDTTCPAHTSNLEPILDQHESCDEDFKRDLDRMLERVTERVR